MKDGTANRAKHLHDILKRELEGNRYGKGEKLPSVRELSAIHQVNKSTVVNVLATLANEGLIVTEAGRGSFALGAKELDKQIAVLFFDNVSPFRVDTEVLGHIQRNIRSGYFLSLHDTSQNYKVFERKIEMLADSGVKGFIAIPPKFYTPKPSEVDYLNRLLGDKIPLIFVIRDIEGVNADFFSMDLDRGVQKAVNYLASIDKKKIALIKHDSKKFIDEELRGLETACRKHGIAIHPEFILEYGDNVIISDEGNIEQIGSKLLAVLPEIDAIIAPDHTLCSVQGLIRESGRSIPSQLSIIGINDVVSHYFSPPLTSIRFPVEQIGINAIQTMMDRLEQAGPAEKIRRNFVPELVIRDT